MKESDKIKLKQSERRARLAELSAKAELTEAEQTEMDTLTTEYRAAETRYQAAVILEEEERAKIADEGDAEDRERRALASRSLVGRYLLSAVGGQRLDGAELEYRAACGVADGIPFALFDDAPLADRRTEERADAATTQPASGIPINPAMIAPAVFANALVPRLGVEMPMVPSGSYGQPRISASLTAGAQAKGGAQESTAATIAMATTDPHRISGRLTLRIEDLYGSGLPDMEASLRQNLTMVMSAAVDSAALTGSGASNAITGLHTRVTADTAATAVVDYESGVESIAALVDGVWARSKRDLQLVVNQSAYAKFSALWRGANADTSLADHFEAMLAGFEVHSRMPANDATDKNADALVVRRGQTGIRLAVLPVWANSLMIDDPYTDSASGLRHVTVHTILGDVLMAQPDAYKRVSFKTAS